MDPDRQPRPLRSCNLTVTGPRQSGKTTLCRAAFPDLDYINLERPDVRERAVADPRGFLARCGDGAIFDEIQRAPELVSYIQTLVDEAGPGECVVGRAGGLSR